MTTFFPAQLRCRRCNQHFSYLAVGSCNTIDAVFYTDGYVEGPMFVEDSAILTCPGCGQLQWHDEFEEEEGGEGPFVETTNGPVLLKLSGFPKLLKLAPWRNREEEIYVRMRAWWAANKRFREKQSPRPFSKAEQANLLALLEALDDAEPIDRICAAEILRELGRFEESAPVAMSRACGNARLARK